jgi:hypothetical protein
MTSINLTPSAEDEILRLENGQGADELNVDGKSYKPDHWRAFHVPRKHVTPSLLSIGGFYEKPITKWQSLRDVASAIHFMPACAERVALTAALANVFEEVER